MPALNQFMRDVIAEGYARGLPLAEIARLAGTTYESARTTASRMGLKHPGRFRPTNSDPAGWTYNSQPTSPPMTPQYKAWLRAKEGAAETLKAQRQQPPLSTEFTGASHASLTSHPMGRDG